MCRFVCGCHIGLPGGMRAHSHLFWCYTFGRWISLLAPGTHIRKAATWTLFSFKSQLQSFLETWIKLLRRMSVAWTAWTFTCFRSYIKVIDTNECLLSFCIMLWIPEGYWLLRRDQITTVIQISTCRRGRFNRIWSLKSLKIYEMFPPLKTETSNLLSYVTHNTWCS